MAAASTNLYIVLASLAVAFSFVDFRFHFVLFVLHITQWHTAYAENFFVISVAICICAHEKATILIRLDYPENPQIIASFYTHTLFSSPSAPPQLRVQSTRKTFRFMYLVTSSPNHPRINTMDTVYGQTNSRIPLYLHLYIVQGIWAMIETNTYYSEYTNIKIERKKNCFISM